MHWRERFLLLHGAGQGALVCRDQGHVLNVTAGTMEDMDEARRIPNELGSSSQIDL